MDKKSTPTQAGEKTKKPGKLEKIEQRMADLAKKRRAIQARENEKKRKERTRRLIQIGAIAIKYLECSRDIEPQEFEEKIKWLVESIDINNVCEKRKQDAFEPKT